MDMPAHALFGSSKNARDVESTFLTVKLAQVIFFLRRPCLDSVPRHTEPLGSMLHARDAPIQQLGCVTRAMLRVVLANDCVIILCPVLSVHRSATLSLRDCRRRCGHRLPVRPLYQRWLRWPALFAHTVLLKILLNAPTKSSRTFPSARYISCRIPHRSASASSIISRGMSSRLAD